MKGAFGENFGSNETRKTQNGTLHTAEYTAIRNQISLMGSVKISIQLTSICYYLFMYFEKQCPLLRNTISSVDGH